MATRNIGFYQVKVRIENHEFVFQALPEGGIECINETIPSGCSMAENGHSPFYLRAKREAGRDLASRPRRRRAQ